MSDLFYIKEIQSLFADVQMSQIFEDQKTMTDAIPKFPISLIMSKYENEKSLTYFNLKDFVLNNFNFTESEEKLRSGKSLEIEAYIDSLWDVFTKKAEDNIGTLLKLPKSYIVPGGRFNEFFYWDSYFVMLGLQISGKLEMMKNILENCAYLIEEFGFVPNASRSHFLTRSQPPFFSTMLDLMVESTQDESFYIQYFGILEMEYNFWMNGSEKLSNGEALNRVYKTKEGYFLNRYYDSENEPRPEKLSY
ncbi:trehalase family glycosidase [Halpernia sp. GG3]